MQFEGIYQITCWSFQISILQSSEVGPMGFLEFWRTICPMFSEMCLQCSLYFFYPRSIKAPIFVPISNSPFLSYLDIK